MTKVSPSLSIKLGRIRRVVTPIALVRMGPRPAATIRRTADRFGLFRSVTLTEWPE